MHGKALALGPNGDRSARLVEAPIAPIQGDDHFEESAWGFNHHALRLNMSRDAVLALTILFLALAAGLASIWLIKPVYSARATVQIDPNLSRVLSIEDIVPDAARTDSDHVLQAQVELLASRSVAEDVANKLDLVNNVAFLREVGVDDEPAGLLRSAKLTTALQDKLSSTSPSAANVVAIGFNSHDPVIAARIANTFADTLISESLRRRLVAYDYSRRFLRGRLEVTKAHLDRAQRDLTKLGRTPGPGGVALYADYSRARAERVEALERWQRWQRAMAAPKLTSSVSLVTPAETPVTPAYPRPAINMALAALVGALALGAAIARSRINHKAQARDEVERNFNERLLGAMPLPLGAEVAHSQIDDEVEESGEAEREVAAPLPSVVPFPLGAKVARRPTADKVQGPQDVERDFDAPLLGVVPLPKAGEDILPASSDPGSPGAEAHHGLFVALDRLARTADQRVLLLTSSGPDEGTSPIACALSANFAAAGWKVLVIDTDLRRGSLHRTLGLSNQLGLADLLAKGSTYGLTELAQFCATRGFSVIPRGLSATKPAERLASRRFAELLDEAVNLYDMVIMDGPPVLGRADAPRLGVIADATIFVLQAKRTVREQAKLAIARLVDAGTGQIGLVIGTDESGAAGAADGPNHSIDEQEIVPEGTPGAEPALSSAWASWLVAHQQEGSRNAR
jgi:capsular exopolysaccharide synthesis family protein